METRSRMYIFIFLIVLISYRIEGLPNTRIDSAHSSLNSSEASLNNHRSIKTSDNAFTHRKILSKGSSNLNSDNKYDGKIVFPTEDESTELQRFVPRINTACENSTFCEVATDYPNEYIDNILRMNKDFKLFSDVDVVPPVKVPDVAHRINTSPEDPVLCDSEERVVYPKQAETKNNEQLFVVNHGELIQGVRIEKCRNENAACRLIDGFLEGYRTFCKQKYIYRQLLALSKDGQTVKPEMFRFPASCCCHLKFTGIRTDDRSNFNKKSNMSSSKIQGK